MMTEEKTKIEGAAKDEDLTVLRMTAKAENKNLALEDLTLRNNVRHESEYNLPPLVESIKKNCYRPSAPIVVHIGEDGVCEVLAGNRRTNALRSLSEDERKQALAAFDGKVPCVVYKGLTPAQVEILRCDHGTDEDRQPLSKYGLFVAVCRLLIAGLGQLQIAERLGLYIVKDGNKKPNRSLVQIYANAAKLPGRVQDMLKEYWLTGSGTIRVSDIAALTKLWNEEWVTHGIDGREGPKFEAKVDEIINRDSSTPDKTTKSLSAAAANERAQVMTSPTTRRLLVAATKSDGSELAQLDAELSARDVLLKQVDWLFKHKKSQIQRLLKAAADGIEKEAQEAKDDKDDKGDKDDKEAK